MCLIQVTKKLGLVVLVGCLAGGCVSLSATDGGSASGPNVPPGPGIPRVKNWNFNCYINTFLELLFTMPELTDGLRDGSISVWKPAVIKNQFDRDDEDRYAFVIALKQLLFGVRDEHVTRVFEVSGGEEKIKTYEQIFKYGGFFGGDRGGAASFEKYAGRSGGFGDAAGLLENFLEPLREVLKEGKNPVVTFVDSHGETQKSLTIGEGNKLEALEFGRPSQYLIVDSASSRAPVASEMTFGIYSSGPDKKLSSKVSYKLVGVGVNLTQKMHWTTYVLNSREPGEWWYLCDDGYLSSTPGEGIFRLDDANPLIYARRITFDNILLRSFGEGAVPAILVYKMQSPTGVQAEIQRAQAPKLLVDLNSQLSQLRQLVKVPVVPAVLAASAAPAAPAAPVQVAAPAGPTVAAPAIPSKAPRVGGRHV